MSLFNSMGAGNLFGMIKSFLNPQKGYSKGQDELNKYYNQAQGYMQPYVQQGQQAYGGLSGAMDRLLDPIGLQSEWTQSYETSPYAQDLMNRAQSQGLSAASSMGLLGSTPALQAMQAGTTQIANADRQRYLEDLMQKYITGAELAQGIYGQGAQASGIMGQNAMNMGGESANMAFGKQNAPGQLFGNLLGTAAGLGGSYMGMRGANNMANAWNTRGGQ
jgi:hypothetical protein